jgi:hypothetical protein
MTVDTVLHLLSKFQRNTNRPIIDHDFLFGSCRPGICRVAKCHGGYHHIIL